MKLLIVILTCFLLPLSFQAIAQTKGKGKKDDQPAAGYSNLPSSLSPGTSKETSASKKQKKSKSSGKVTYDQQRAYYERVEEVARARQKEAKILEKPQYSNPMYFGHKKMPKKRPPHKMRFCKECGIRH
jgi:hypothetical protein